MNLRQSKTLFSFSFVALAALLSSAACSSPTTDDAGDAATAETGTDTGTDTGTMDSGTDTGMADTGSDTTPPTDTGTDSAPPTDGGGPSAACTAYCTTIMANCTTDNAQYVSMDACLGSCAGFPAGTVGATSGNSLGCRTYHATAAATGAALHCPHAGPSGGSVCGTLCEGFCSIAMSACTGANMEFATNDACMTACAGFATTPDYSTTTSSGNSYACRLYHLTVASSSAANATTHCPHIVTASPVCM